MTASSPPTPMETSFPPASFLSSASVSDHSTNTSGTLVRSSSPSSSSSSSRSPILHSAFGEHTSNTSLCSSEDFCSQFVSFPTSSLHSFPAASSFYFASSLGSHASSTSPACSSSSSFSSSYEVTSEATSTLRQPVRPSSSGSGGYYSSSSCLSSSYFAPFSLSHSSDDHRTATIESIVSSASTSSTSGDEFSAVHSSSSPDQQPPRLSSSFVYPTISSSLSSSSSSVSSSSSSVVSSSSVSSLSASSPSTAVSSLSFSAASVPVSLLTSSSPSFTSSPNASTSTDSSRSFRHLDASDASSFPQVFFLPEHSLSSPPTGRAVSFVSSSVPSFSSNTQIGNVPSFPGQSWTAETSTSSFVYGYHHPSPSDVPSEPYVYYIVGDHTTPITSPYLPPSPILFPSAAAVSSPAHPTPTVSLCSPPPHRDWSSSYSPYFSSFHSRHSRHFPQSIVEPSTSPPPPPSPSPHPPQLPQSPNSSIPIASAVSPPPLIASEISFPFPTSDNQTPSSFASLENLLQRHLRVNQEYLEKCNELVLQLTRLMETIEMRQYDFN